MSQFKPGDKVKCVQNSRSKSGPRLGAIYTVLKSNAKYTHVAELPPNYQGGWDNQRFVIAVAATKEQKAIARKEAELAALREKAALKAKNAAELKAKREREKLMAGLSKAGQRVVERLIVNSEMFGCQRQAVIELAAAITGDDADKMRKALA